MKGLFIKFYHRFKFIYVFILQFFVQKLTKFSVLLKITLQTS